MHTDQPATYREVFAVREYRHLFAANVLSLLGDQLAKVALTFLVFDTTGSAALAATAFAVSYVPWIVGGPVLAAYADRLPRRTVLIASDVVRGLLVAVMVVPGLAYPALIALLFVANLFRPPFVSARAAMMPDVLEGDRYVVAAGVDNITIQVAQVLGFALGGALVTLLTPRGALLVDAVTFGASALFIVAGVHRRPAAAGGVRRSALRDFGGGAALVFSDRTLRAYLLLFWFASAFTYTVEGLAAPLAVQYGGGAQTGGLVLAAAPLGVTVGGVLVTRFCPPAARLRLILPLAFLSCAILVPVASVPPLWGLLLLLVVAGLGGAFNIPLAPIFGRTVPDEFRGRAFGVAVAGVNAAQGLAMIAAGVVADHLAATTVIGWSGVAGTLAVLAVRPIWPVRAPGEQPGQEPGDEPGGVPGEEPDRAPGEAA